MKFCTHCGSQIPDEAVICVHCGCPVNQNVFQQQNVLQQQQNVKRKPSALAITAFLLAIIATALIYLSDFVPSELFIFVPVIVIIVAFVISIVSLVKIKRNNLWGMGFSIAALILSSFYIFLIMLGFLIGILMALGLIIPEIPEIPGNNLTSLIFNLI